MTRPLRLPSSNWAMVGPLAGQIQAGSSPLFTSGLVSGALAAAPRLEPLAASDPADAAGVEAALPSTGRASMRAVVTGLAEAMPPALAAEVAAASPTGGAPRDHPPTSIP